MSNSKIIQELLIQRKLIRGDWLLAELPNSVYWQIVAINTKLESLGYEF